MDVLGAKLGPVVLQFPFFNKSVFQDRKEFLDRLVPFLTKLPAGYKFALEIRNRNWLDAEFAHLLRDRSIALVLQDRSWCKAIEQQTMTWDKTVIDRSGELSSWVDFC
jgi:uncharacterized protein YecE (DUF72 family)